jgi:carbonic anhydrase
MHERRPVILVPKSKRFTIVIVVFLIIAWHLRWNVEPLEKELDQNVINQGTLYTRPEVITAPTEAMLLLKVGNERFAAGKILGKDIGKARQNQLAETGQHPFAIIVSCSDSRVPPELVFDQALGDLFVIRVAGNVVNAIEMGSIEYGVEHLHAPLIVVMGHEQCGAIEAAVDGVEISENIKVIVDKIRPAIDLVIAGGNGQLSGKALYEPVTDANVLEVVKLISTNRIIQKEIAEKKLIIVGAKYHLKSGQVTYFTDATR